ncbi:uncharacterized protein LOC120686223 isoform X2 [Panicum virgatum]|uniref:Uncharacterized protein n=1 Tax=Panicum virgatum TaxID=38727 RepID=A0A8T0PG46_PANVG|nr:uncharacterized protein LOC120686223 isoform X2 [Panicum virgatum]KAG2557394.1 hypothetical protein PVAP13_8NG255701 [Panicum virgatum]
MPAHLECGASMPARLGFGRAALPTTTSPHRRHPQAPVPHPSKLDPERSLELLPRIPLAGEVDIHRFRPLLGKSSRLKTRICEAGSCCKSECAVRLARGEASRKWERGLYYRMLRRCKAVMTKKGCPAGLGTSEPIEVCTKKKVLICVDSSSSDEAGASIGKNLHKGKSPQATYLEAFDKQKVS